MPPIAIMPAASPSRPSTKFTAFIATTITITVAKRLRRADAIVTPPMGTVMSWTPRHATKPAASTWPTSLVSQSRSQMSSAMPSAQTMPAAMTIAQSSCPPGPAKVERRKGVPDAKVTATARPHHMARPPRRGVGMVWTSRSRTAVMAFVRSATQWARGTVRSVTARATSRTSR